MSGEEWLLLLARGVGAPLCECVRVCVCVCVFWHMEKGDGPQSFSLWLLYQLMLSIIVNLPKAELEGRHMALNQSSHESYSLTSSSQSCLTPPCKCCQ